MATVELTGRSIEVRELVGTALTIAGLRLVAAQAVTGLTVDAQQLLSAEVVDGEVDFEVRDVALRHDAGGDQAILAGSCGCGVEGLCPHRVAVLLTPSNRARRKQAPARREPARPEPEPEPTPPQWRQAFAPVVAASAIAVARTLTTPARDLVPGPDHTRWGVQLTLGDDGPGGVTVTAKPIRSTADGRRWQRSGASWSSWQYTAARPGTPAAAAGAVVEQLLSACGSSSRYGYGYYSASEALELTGQGRHVWELLADLQATGTVVVAGTRYDTAVQVHTDLLGQVSVREQDGDLRVSAHVTAGGGAVPVTATPLDDRGGGPVALVWPAPPDPSGHPSAGRTLHVAVVPRDLAPSVRALAGMQPFVVPAVDAERFVAEYLSTLPAAVQVRTSGAVPPAPGPRLRLAVTSPSPDAVEVGWSWDRGPGARPDPAAEAEVLEAVSEALPERAGLLRGMDAVRFVTDRLPQLRAVAGVDVHESAVPDYRPAATAPVVTFAPASAPGSAAGTAVLAERHDWFDLDITITVDGRGVPFAVVFTALARGDDHVVLDDGTYFPLEHERFAELARLIEESRQLGEGPEGGLRLTRFQAGCWAELERLGVVEGQAREWAANARRIADAPQVGEFAVPAGLAATLRPYQRGGFGWLATLYANGLGGVLADDMGLGKTLQTLALFCHVYEQDAGAPPFLVVAPTSVVAAWQSEAATFAPGLRVVTITETAARRGGTKIADLALGAHVVVTSYTLFRLEHDQYAGESWAGLVLDEAQTVKNYQSRAYACARQLRTEFVLAISGTPMENSLMELWAVVSLVAPGLLGSPTRFTEYFRSPIERSRDADRLAQLRRRIGPLLLRRTKEQVADDLPPKQEQVLDIALAPKHRAAYQGYLQRERRKVLGLLGDMNGNRFEILRSLTVLRQAALDVALVDADRAGVPATKLDVLTDLVTEIAGEGHRVLVFSQFTRFLRSARDRLNEAGVATCYLDGTTRRRHEVIQSFRQGDAPAFLISLKAGGTGLTLTEADYCILLDPWWNPATENQAVDRTHRIGQTRPVMVYRLVAQDTIEEKVMALKAAKAELFAGVLDGGDFSSAALTVDDIRALVE